MSEGDREETHVELPDLQSTILQTTLEQVASASDKDCCVICLGEISELCEAQPCGHRHFDYICLITWLEQRKSCPLCKSFVQTVRFDFSSDGHQWKTHDVPTASAKEPAEHASSHHTREPSRSPPGPRSDSFRAYLASRTGRHDRYPTSRHSRPRVPRDTTFEDALARRRHVYRNQLFSLHVGSNRVSRYRELTPQLIASDAELVSRARMFLRRELQVFEFLSPDHAPDNSSTSTHGDTDPQRLRRANNTEFLLEYIVAILKTVDMQGSMGQAEELIHDFVGRENARLLLHELRAWLRSPHLSLEAWDRAVQYPQLDKGPQSRRPPRRAFINNRDPQSRRASHAALRRSRPPARDVTYPSTWRRGDEL